MPTAKLGTGLDIYFEVHGTGEPLVLIPGTGFAGSVWDLYQVPELSKRLQVITFDPRGCGRSSTPAGYYTIEQMASDLAALLDSLEIQSAHLLGHSMGGRIGLAFALAYPRRVKSLVLAASGSGAAARTGEECVIGIPFRMVNDLVRMGFEQYVRMEFFESTTYFTKEFLAKEPDRINSFYQMAWKHHAKWEPFLRLVMARHNWEATHRLGEIFAPTLIVVGDNDDVGSNHVEQATALAKRIRNSERLILKGQSHGFFWQAPEQTNAWIIDWVLKHADRHHHNAETRDPAIPKV